MVEEMNMPGFREANFLLHPTAWLWSGGYCEHPQESTKVVLPTRGQTVIGSDVL